MAQSIANLAIDLSANIAGFTSDLGRANRAAEKAAKKLEQDFSKAGKAMGLAIVAGLAVVATGVTQSIKAMDRLGDAAKRVGTSASSLSALGYAADQSGTKAETLEQGLLKLSQTMAKAAAGSEKQAGLFADIGVAVTTATGELRSADAVFLDIANRFQEYKDGAGETALAAALFGKAAGPQLKELLNEGADGITDLTDQARDLGIVMGDDAVEAAQQFSDRMDTLGAVTRGFFNDVATQLLPSLNALSGVLIKQRAELGETATSMSGIATVLQTVGRWMLTVAKYAEVVGAAMADVFFRIGKEAEQLPERLEIVKVRLTAFAQQLSGQFASANMLRDAADEAERQLDQRLNKSLASAQEALVDTFADIDKRYNPRIKALTAGVADFSNVVVGAGKAAGKTAPPIASLGKVAEKTGYEVHGLKEELDLTKESLEASDPAIRKIEQSWQRFQNSIANVGAELRDQQIGAGMAEELELATRASDEAAAEWEATWGNLYDSLGAAFGDFIAGNLESWEDFGDALKSIAKNFLSDLVRQFASTTLRANVSTGTGGAGAGGFSFGGNQSTLSNGAFGGLGLVAGIGASFVGGTNSTTSALGGLAAGAATGAIYGSIIPVIGTLVGAVIGGVIGLIGGYFAATDIPSINVIGSDLIGRSPYANLAPDARFSTQLGDFAFASIDEVDRETRDQLKKAITEFDNAIAGFLDDEQLARVKDALAGFNLQLQEGAISAENFIQARFDVILGTFDEATQEMVRGAGDLEAQMRKLGEVLQYPKLLAELLDSLTEGDMLAGMTEFERGIYQINKSFDEAIAAAEILGATEEELAKIESFRTNALERLARLQEEQLDALLEDIEFDEMTLGMSEFEKENARINKTYDDLRDAAIALGATQEQLEMIERARTRALQENTEAMEDNIEVLATLPDIFDAMNDEAAITANRLDAFRDAARNVADFLADQIFGTSSASPLERIRAAQEQFEEQARLAAGGNVQAISSLPQFAQRLLSEASTFFGVGSDQFGGIEAFIRSVLDPIGSIAGANNMADVQNELNRTLQVLNTQLARQGQPGSTDPNLIRAVNGVSSAVAETNRLLNRIAADRGPRVAA